MDEIIENAKVHIEFCVKMYWHQMRAGRCFLHEHPLTATSWKFPCVEELATHPMVQKARLDMCQSGMESIDEHGVGAVKTPTTMMTDSIELYRELGRRCTPGS